MVLLTPNDGNVMAAFVQFPNMPDDRKKKRLASLEENDARLVAEVFLGMREDSSVSPAVLATVNHYRKWRDNRAEGRRRREDLREASLRR
jgi:hypothetical protein